jgi:hypothetical protein
LQLMRKGQPRDSGADHDNIPHFHFWRLSHLKAPRYFAA